MFKNIYLTSLLLFSLIQLTGCGSDSDSESSEQVPTSSVLVTSRSPDHNDSNVSTSTNITITVDQSIINENLYFRLFNIDQNDNCGFTWEDFSPPCPSTIVMAVVPTGEMVQGDTLVFKPVFGLDSNTNYLVVLTNDMTSSSDDDFKIYWTFRTGSSTVSNIINTGVFLDSPVINIGYRTETLQGVTSSLGEYEYITGETVAFFIGDLEFPAITAKGTVTPLDLAETVDINNSKVVNMIRLLQTLDQDGNPDNGLMITDIAKSAATQVDFTLSVSDFESSTAITALIPNAGQDPSVSNLVTATSAISHFQGQLDALEKLNFNADTLVGRYNVVFAAVEGTHRYTFSADGTVFIIWADGTSQTVAWSVNNNGELVFSGSIDDIFTLTSGDQSSGNLNVVLKDNDEINTTGTIELVPGVAFDGSYTITVTSTTLINNIGTACHDSTGSMDISNSSISGSLTNDVGFTFGLSGDVQSDGTLSGIYDFSGFVITYDGTMTGTSGSGTWENSLLCAGIWEATKN